jgi:hypothetical protein
VNMDFGGGGVIALRILVSIFCVAIALVHVLFPEVTIDFVTLGLLIAAALPWLSPILKSIELPGGFKVELQELKREVMTEVAAAKSEVKSLGERVDTVEGFIFEGVSPEREVRLSHELTAFRNYLAQLGAPFAEGKPTVKVVPRLDDAYYDRSSVVVGEIWVDEPSIVLHAYGHYALQSMWKQIKGAHDIERFAKMDHVKITEAALADYLTASFLNDPQVRTTVQIDDAPLKSRDLSERVAIPSALEQDVHWRSLELSSRLWKRRMRLSRRRMDTAVIAGWHNFCVHDFSGEYLNEMIKQLTPEEQQRIADIPADYRTPLGDQHAAGEQLGSSPSAESG